MRVAVIAAATVVVASGASVPAPGYDGPVGMASLLAVRELPRLYSGARMCQASSHDRGGGNYDSGNFVRRIGDEFVLMEAKGPGQICRLWLTNASANHHIRVYVDGETAPRIVLTVTQLFSGSVYPFVWPLVGNDAVSSGGYYSYVPIPFRKGCRVTTDCKDLYYNVQYQLFDSDRLVRSYDPCADPRAAAALWLRAGSDLIEHGRAKRFEEKGRLGAGGSLDLLDFKGSGRIVGIRIALKDLGDSDRALALLRGVRLRMRWDGAKTPAVDAPIGPFHCVWFPDSVAKGLFAGSVKPGEFYCYWPMPFARNARISLANLSELDAGEVSAQVDVLPSTGDAAMLKGCQLGRFHASYRTRTLKEGDPDYLFADVTGRGVALGVSALMIGGPGQGQGFLEGDERVFIDGAAKPQLHGTGTEDFFNGGYYFDRGLFTLPLHGYTARRYELRDHEAMYRQFFADRIPFERSLRFGIEHGGTNDQSGDYTSVFYYYSAEPNPSRPEPVEWRRASGRILRQAQDAKEAGCSLRGTITTKDGEKVAGAVVAARDKDGRVCAEVLSCPDGSYELRGLKPGVYDIRAEGPRIVPYTFYEVLVEANEPTSLPFLVESSCANLLAKADMSDEFENGVATKWNAFNTEGYRGELSRCDEGVQRIHCPQPAEGDANSGLFEKIRVVPSQIYVFSAECKTAFGGDEENPWDNIMARLCFDPLGTENFRSRNVDCFQFPPTHNVWHKLSQEVAAVGDIATVYLAAWRKFDRGGDDADVWFRNASFYGPTAPPKPPRILSATIESGRVSVVWESGPDVAVVQYAVSASKNERDIVGSWEDAGHSGSTQRAVGADSTGSLYCLMKCRNSLGVWSEMSVREIGDSVR